MAITSSGSIFVMAAAQFREAKDAFLSRLGTDVALATSRANFIAKVYTDSSKRTDAFDELASEYLLDERIHCVEIAYSGSKVQLPPRDACEALDADDVIEQRFGDYSQGIARFYISYERFNLDSRHQLLLAIAAVAVTGASFLIATLILLRLVDSSHRKEADRQAERYQKLFQGSLDAVVLLTDDARIIDANDAALALFGYQDRAAFIASSLPDWMPEVQPDGTPSAEGAFRMFRRCNEQGSGEFEWQHRRRDSGELWFGQVLLQRMKFSEGGVIIARVRDISERQRYEQKLYHLAYRDALTGLPNRSAALAWLEEQRQSDQALCWLLINLDVDDFRAINDSFGQQCGDQLLIALTKRLQALLPDGAYLARLGSDEFLVVIAEGSAADAAPGRQKAEEWCRQIQELARTDMRGEQEFPLLFSLSLGVLLEREAPGGALEMLSRVESALQQAKESGPASVQFYDADLSRLIQRRLELEQEMEIALVEQRFHLMYQPQVDAQGRMVGVEVLLRFTSSEGQPVSPAEFIPLAERTGQIHRVGAWVFQAACSQLAAWRAQGLLLPDVSINVSARQFEDVAGLPPLLEQLQGQLRRWGLSPDQLCLEITETALLKQGPVLQQAIEAIVAAGFCFSLDDFGAGYSSFSIIRDFQLAELKVDKGYVDAIEASHQNRSIVKAMVELAEAESIRLVAEGVETESQFAALKQLGVMRFQGFLFCKPLSAQAFAVLLQQQQGSHLQP
ncbi:MAG: EAL domain-containing protein [Synechococcus sp. WH 8007]|nr:EAL domain-containing protein [Synechococcus sp. WH 8007]